MVFIVYVSMVLIIMFYMVGQAVPPASAWPWPSSPVLQHGQAGAFQPPAGLCRPAYLIDLKRNPVWHSRCLTGGVVREALP